MEVRGSMLMRPWRRLLASNGARSLHEAAGGSGNHRHKVDAEEESSAMYDNKAFPMLMVNENTFKQEMKNSQRSKNPPYVLVEGRRCILDSLAAGARLRTLLFTQRSLLKDLPFQDSARVMFVHSRLLKKWSDVRSPSGLFALIYTPRSEELQYLNATSKISLICDQVRDPTNMGVILRSAAAFGLRRVIVVRNSVNVWSPKVLRGGMSAHFRLPIYSDVPWSTVDDLLDDDTQVHVAEGCNRVREGFESAVYHEPDYAASGRPQALVIGHETEGISASALSLSARTGGQRLTIPMRSGMDSVNVATAASVILSEIVRQLDLVRA